MEPQAFESPLRHGCKAGRSVGKNLVCIKSGAQISDLALPLTMAEA
jgi:hypothetical protein